MTDSRQTVGLIGVGAMGSEIAHALIDGGHSLAVCDSDPDALEPVVGRGARACTDPADVADLATTVFLSLPSPAIVRDVAGRLVGGGAVKTVIDLSTTGSMTRELAPRLAESGIELLDAPLTGGVAAARRRELTVLAAGDRALFERTRPLLETFGKAVIRVGDEPGQGQLAKVLNNLLSATALAATSEVMTLGIRAGLDPELLLEAFNAGSGRNTATAAKFPSFVLDRSFDSHFELALMLKDVRLCLDEATAIEHPMILGTVVEQLWGLAAREAGPGADHTEVVRLFEGWSGVQVRADAGGDDERG